MLESNQPNTAYDAAASTDMLISHLELEEGDDPTTCGLRNRCSTAELHWHCFRKQKRMQSYMKIRTGQEILNGLAKFSAILHFLIHNWPVFLHNEEVLRSVVRAFV